MGRSPCCSKDGLNKGAWTAMEDKILKDYIKIYGQGRWRKLPKKAGLNRCGKSCRLRWLNYLRPDIKRGNISKDEEDLIIRLHELLGNRWSLIAGRLPGRTDNEIKNYWNTNIAKRRNAVTCSTKISEESSVSQPPLSYSYSLGPDVIHTKATRASVTNPQCIENYETEPAGLGQQSHVENIENHKADSVESDQFDKFFSDLFGTDFFNFSDQNLDNGFREESFSATKDSHGRGDYSHNSCQITAEKQHDLDIGSMISIDPSMDWFQLS